jgi:hypothetical protein
MNMKNTDNHYKIETHVPIPSSYNRTNTRKILLQLKVGQSITAPHTQANAAKAHATRLNNETNMRFTTRKTDEGCRIWRIE